MSGLAVQAGLDATAFNRSKRLGLEGRERWPSMESIAKVLSATGIDFTTFARFAEASGAKPQAEIPVVPANQIDHPGLIDADGRPCPSPAWDITPFPGAVDALFGLLMETDQFAPHYREGDVILVAPGHPLRRGDKVLLKTRPDGFMLGVFAKRSATTIDIRAFGQEGPPLKIRSTTVQWAGRVVWASQ